MVDAETYYHHYHHHSYTTLLMLQQTTFERINEKYKTVAHPLFSSFSRNTPNIIIMASAANMDVMGAAWKAALRRQLRERMTHDLQAVSTFVRSNTSSDVDGREYAVDQVMSVVSMEEMQQRDITEYIALMNDMVECLMDDTKVSGDINKKRYIRDVITMAFGCWCASHSYCVSDRLPSESLSGWNQMLEASVCPEMLNKVQEILDEEEV